MAKKTKVNEQDLAAFHEAMKGSKLLIQKKVKLTAKSIKNEKPPSFIEQENFCFNEYDNLDNVTGETTIAYKQSSISNKTLRKLRKGQYNVEAVLDLHGLSIEKAKTELEVFLNQCLNDNMRCILVIHGKGRHSQMPVLKNKLNHWLRNQDNILAFCAADSIHGSRGALYVLLKAKVEEKFA